MIDNAGAAQARSGDAGATGANASVSGGGSGGGLEPLPGQFKGLKNIHRLQQAITALQHARVLRDGRQPPTETQVEVRPLARYDALIA